MNRVGAEARTVARLPCSVGRMGVSAGLRSRWMCHFNTKAQHIAYVNVF
jgi:hypothetical protein